MNDRRQEYFKKNLLAFLRYQLYGEDNSIVEAEFEVHEFPEDLIERCTRAGYEARRIKTGSPPWEQRDPGDQRKYREVVTAAIRELLMVYPDLGEEKKDESERSAH